MSDAYAASPEVVRALFDMVDPATNFLMFFSQASKAEAMRLKEPKVRRHQEEARYATKMWQHALVEMGQGLDRIEAIRAKERAR